MDLARLTVNKIRTELWTCHILSEQRCLRKACEWAEDLLFAMKDEGEEKLLSKLEKDLNDPLCDMNPQYEHARMCFEMQEYDRAAHILQHQLHDDKSRFLHYFSKYKGAEKKRFDLMHEVTITIPKKALLKFNELRDSLERCMEQRDPDGWLLYVYGLILYKFKLYKHAIDVLVKSINLIPINWSAWHMLTLLVNSKETLDSLELPNHQFKVFFYFKMRLDLDIPKDEPWTLVSSKDCKNYLDKHFKESLFVITLNARSLDYQSTRCHKTALDLFGRIREADPYRLDAMEVYSNLLYIKKMRKELSQLAYDVERIDPFTTEANTCIANAFSAREQHTKAIMYFTRALRINPDLANPWILIGHEYLEMKSTDNAEKAYRNAISINKRDCRAWLGLANAVETKQGASSNQHPNFEQCLYYYSQVAKFRPTNQNNLNMFIGMGSIYEKINDLKRAIACYKQAGQDGLFKLAKLYESNNMREEAAELSIYLSQ